MSQVALHLDYHGLDPNRNLFMQLCWIWLPRRQRKRENLELATTISASDIQKIQHNCHFSFYHLSSQRELQWNEGFPTLTQHSLFVCLFVCLCLTVSYSDQTVFCQNLEHALKSLSCTSNFGSVCLLPVSAIFEQSLEFATSEHSFEGKLSSLTRGRVIAQTAESFLFSFWLPQKTCTFCF